MISIDDIVKKEFSRSFLGYDMREVDLFLDAIIEQLEADERERQEMLTAMEYLLRELEQFDDIAGDADRQLRESVEAVRRAAAPRHAPPYSGAGGGARGRAGSGARRGVSGPVEFRQPPPRAEL